MNALHSDIKRACLTLERYKIETHANIEISSVNRDDGTIFIKSRGENDIHDVSACSDSALLHAELYSRFSDVRSILFVNSEWIKIASGAGWTLDRKAYGYIPSFCDTVPCTARIRTHVDSGDYPTAFCDAVSDVITKEKLPRAVLVRGLGALVFADTPMDAAEYAITLEYAAKKAFLIRKFR